MDIFNPNHYIPRLYLEEEISSITNLDIDKLNHKFASENFFQSPQATEDYKAFELDENKNINISKEKQIIDFISGKKGFYTTNFEVHSNCVLVLRSNPFTEQLIYHNINFIVNKGSSLKLFIYNNIDKPFKIKNNFIFNIGENSKVEVEVLSLTKKEQYLDDSIAFIHSKNSQSTINYRSFTQGTTVSQVNSVIPINAENSQTSQNLKHTMMEEGAKIFSKPNLEILNPNVSASHGNSIGTISDDDLQYLAFRGINSNSANKLIVQSQNEHFVNNIIEAFC